MLQRTEAIVLKTTPFSEADLIVTFLSSDCGLLKTFAKSPRKVKSRFGSSLEPLTHAKISFWGREDAGLPRLTQSDIVRPFQSVRDDLESFFSMAEILELTLNLLPEREPNRDIFRLLWGILDAIDTDYSRLRLDKRRSKGFLDCLVLFSKVKLLDMAGYGPALEGCARCGRSGVNFYIAHGSVICGACTSAMDGQIKVSPGAIELYATLRKWETSKIARIRPSGTMLAELSGLIDAHLRYTLSKPLRTRGLQV
ncbi:MAG TPA: DNA repair protein RecO [Thermodesulfovibrionales bacterium]|nr:DNA repair protein RecO [Thermodesulfovibrionales bacterium]